MENIRSQLIARSLYRHIVSKYSKWADLPCRRYSVPVMNVFDRQTKLHQKNQITKDHQYKQYQYIKDEVGFRVFDRLCDVKRTFDTAVDLGCGLGHATKHITLLQQLVTNRIYMIEASAALLEKAEKSPDVPCTRVHCDEETLTELPFEMESIDAVYSSLSLHWVNDLPGLCRRVLQMLKRDGVFVGSLFGTDTLYELRVSLQLAEQEIIGESFLLWCLPHTPMYSKSCIQMVLACAL